MSGFSGTVRAVSFLGDKGEYVVAGGADGRVLVSQLATYVAGPNGGELGVANREPGSISSAVCSGRCTFR